MEIKKMKIPGCVQIFSFHAFDQRGSFLKQFVQSEFKRAHLETDFREDFLSISKKGVIRGLHFQAPPFLATKLVFCILGKAFDVIVDLRKGSPSYLQWEAVALDHQLGNAIYISPGCAHGFAALSDQTILGYKTTSEHRKDFDLGIRWNSLSIPWPLKMPILSERDRSLPLLSAFQSPFEYETLTNSA